MAAKGEKKFTDRESSTYAGLMLSLRKYYDRFEVRHGYELNKKPREIDCLIIDKSGDDEITDNDIARIFSVHNIVELKNPTETLNVDTIWKVISYATQYLSEAETDGKISYGDITITMLRASKPKKAISILKADGFEVENPYPGIYYIRGMVAMKMQIVVSGELKGDEFVPLRIQRKGASGTDYRRFAENVKNRYTKREAEYVETVLKNGLYGDAKVLLETVREDGEMYEKFMDLFKDEFDKAEARGEARGEEERKRLEVECREKDERIKKLEDALKKAKVAVL